MRFPRGSIPYTPVETCPKPWDVELYTILVVKEQPQGICDIGIVSRPGAELSSAFGGVCNSPHEETLGISLSKIRQASEYLRKNLEIRYPLINQRIRVGTDVYFKHAKGILLNASCHGQVESEELIGKYISRIEFGEEDLPDVVYPWIPGKERRSIQINPRIRFGQTTIAGTGISVAAIRDRFKAGESPEDIAASYEISHARVEDALAYAACK